ncbi:MAG: hypothetical protein GY861_09485 [bacterium]|nr:hypothetical protein [bacterium]
MNWKIIVFSVIFVLVVLCTLFIYAYSSETTEEIVETVNKSRIVTETKEVQQTTSFKRYFNDVYEYEGKDVTLTGFLSLYIKGDEKSGIYTTGIFDDYGRIIDLSGVKKEYESLFPKDEVTEELYAVSGVLLRDYQTPRLKARTITLTEREPPVQKEVTKTVYAMEDETTYIHHPRFPLIRNFVDNLFGREVSCEDGTPLEECSENKPYFCEVKGLVKNPIECGCPEGERLYDSNCIPVVKCSDGTFEPECSETKPMKCVNKELVEKASECGCPDDLSVEEDACVRILKIE